MDTTELKTLPDLPEAEFEITAFTCTYNRADTLRRTYESLCNQTVRNFEWIVYDNGSTDNTRELVTKWKSEADFPIVILSRPDNSGYQRSFNHGVKAAKGYFWLQLDSDDEVVPNAFSRMVELWRAIPDGEKPNFTGVTVNCVDQHGKLFGEEFPYNPTDSNSIEIFYKHGIRDEKFGMHRVDVIKDYPFPDVEDHVNAGLVWTAIAQDYQTRFVNESLRIYYVEEEGRPDQLTFHTGLADNAVGRRMNHMHSLNEHLGWFMHNPLQFIKHAVVYAVCSQALSIGMAKATADIKPFFGRLLVISVYPFALMYTLNRKLLETVEPLKKV